MEAAFVVGMVVGAIMALVASYVLLKGNDFTLNTLGFTAFGVLLIGMSVWSQVKIQVNEQGLSFEVLRQQVQQTAEEVLAVAEQVDVAAQALEDNRMRLTSLAGTLVRRDLVPQAEIQRILGPEADIPHVDRERLENTRLRLEDVTRVDPSRFDAAGRVRPEMIDDR